VQETYASLSIQKRSDIEALLLQCDFQNIIAATLSRRIERCETLEVWD
jgi:arginine repressor